MPGLSENMYNMLLVKVAELLAGGVTDTLFQNMVTVTSLPSTLNDTFVVISAACPQVDYNMNYQ